MVVLKVYDVFECNSILYSLSHMQSITCDSNDFDRLLSIQGGLSSGYKKLIAEKGLPDESYTAESIALIRISGTSMHNNKAVQVDAVRPC